MFRLASVHQLEKPIGTCENCGHAIAQVFYVHDTDTGAQLAVGSECVVHLLTGEEKQTADLLRKRMQRAAAQWRKNEPARRNREVRTDYINRRVVEMGNALKAYKAWAALMSDPRLRQGGSAQRASKFAKRFLERCGVEVPKANSSEYLRYYTLVRWVSEAYSSHLYDKLHRRIEKQTCANRYDYTRAIWDVRKI